MPLAGGTFTNVFNYTNANNQLSGVITTSSLTMGNITIVAITTGGQTDNNKIPTKGYVDTLFSQYNPNLFVLVAGGTYNNIYSFENVLNRFGGLFTGKVITNDFTLDNKQMTSITTGGNTNNDKLTTQGYVDSMISQVGTQVTNNYYNKTYIDTQLGDINTELGNINTTIGGLATTAALTAGLALKADKSNTYTKTEIDNMFDGVVPVGDNVGKKYPNSLGGEIFNFYTVDDTTTPPTKNIASGNYSHAENYMTTASGSYSHVEGYITTASGTTTHAEGYMTVASGSISHAEGQETEASGANSHAEGSHTVASGLDSHAGGYGTYADKEYMTVVGRKNVYDVTDPTLNNNKLFVVGNGSLTGGPRSDAFVVKDDGTCEVQKSLIIDGYFFKPVNFRVYFVYERAANDWGASWIYGHGFINGFDSLLGLNGFVSSPGSITQYSSKKIAISMVTIDNRYFEPMTIDDGKRAFPISGIYDSGAVPIPYNCFGLKTSVGDGTYLSNVYLLYWLDGTNRRTDFDCSSASPPWAFSFNYLPFKLKVIS